MIIFAFRKIRRRAWASKECKLRLALLGCAVNGQVSAALARNIIGSSLILHSCNIPPNWIDFNSLFLFLNVREEQTETASKTFFSDGLPILTRLLFVIDRCTVSQCFESTEDRKLPVEIRCINQLYILLAIIDMLCARRYGTIFFTGGTHTRFSRLNGNW